LKSRFGEEPEVKPGSLGQFDVVVDGQVIFSKKEAGRFPAEGEVEERFADLKAGKRPPSEKKRRPPGLLRRIVGRLDN
jgi:selT/selW/selH-like putative selenoprotein